jgi:hypothetical protein
MALDLRKQFKQLWNTTIGPLLLANFDRCDWIHFGIGILALVSCLFPGAAWLVAVIIDLYLIFLVLCAALKFAKCLPNRVPALFVMLALSFTLITAFANVYLHSPGLTKTELFMENGTLKAAPPQPLTEASEAWYVSLATITTYGSDFVPSDRSARRAVTAEILSGALLLLTAFPILISRLAMFDEALFRDGTFQLKKKKEGEWETTVLGTIPATTEIDGMVMTVKSGKVVSVGKPSA